MNEVGDALGIHEYDGQTTIHPLGLIAVIVMGLAMLVLPRKYAAIPMLFMACFIAPAQRLIIAGANFDLLRMMVIFGMVRILSRHEWTGLRWQLIDAVFVCWSVVGAAAYILLWGTAEAVKWKSGQVYDQLGLYVLFRCLIREWDDVWLVAKCLIILSIPVMAAFALECATGRNLFSALGGVPEFTVVREGRLRCQGAFAHPIIAGCFWAAQIPLMVALWWRRERGWAVTGVLCSLAIVAMCASSTPELGVVGAGIGAACFMLRDRMRQVRWAVLAVAIGLHLVMKAPVWYLMARIDLAGGSTGWHRANLITQAIHHFAEWWLLGTHSVAAWGVHAGDVTNQFIIEGVRGGLVAMVLFIAIVSLAFGRVGRLWRSVPNDRPRTVMAWALGISLFVHVTCFMGVSYFGQIIVVWYLLLAIIVNLSGGATVVMQPARLRIVRDPLIRTGVAQV